MSAPSSGAAPRIAVLYVMFEEYDFLEREVELLNPQTFLDFTFVCVSGHQSDRERIERILARAKFATVHLRRTADTGPAGGFHEGQAWCLANGFDAVVHVESDCFPMGSDLMARLAAGVARHAVVAPVCVPDGIPMGWRWCAVRRDVLRSVGLSYRALYFLTEDVYFYRNVTRRFPPEILHDVTVYHAPIIEKHSFTDKFLAAFPYLWSRNHVLFSAMIVRTHGHWKDAVNFAGYLVSLAACATHLALRGKRASARAMFDGIVDGLLFREGRVRKDRVEQTPDDYRVREVPSFDADLVLDKQGFDLGPGTVIASLRSAGRRVLMKRPSTLTLILCYALAASMAITDGRRCWLLKEDAREGPWGRATIYGVVAVTALLSPLLLLLALLCSLRSHATEVPPVAPPAAAPSR
jgi:hypothetical protein